ncbi:MAG: AAA-like domain-containing protein [Clostridia bacterium]|nr:AAA-like domain-containing protein [Clostridia bacterium]
MKVFNTTAVCIPEKHYMVDLSERVKEIKKLVDAGKYFTINRARQYGKTTTLYALDVALSAEYDMISIDFQDVTDADFRNESEFTRGLSQMLCDTRDNIDIPVPDKYYDQFQTLAQRTDNVKLSDLFRIFDRWCRENLKPVVVIIDEVDTATNNQVFLDFLGKLRSNYLKREKKPTYKTFHSVILAGVTDVKYLKGMVRPEGEHKENSPWNIAADFTIDMSLSESGIQGMLDEYEADHHTGMNTAAVAKQIREYTNGYPFLVSRICQLLDERMIPDTFSNLADTWTQDGVDLAVKMILSEENTLFDSLMGKLRTMPGLRGQLKEILFEGETIPNLPDNNEQKQLRMYGFIVNNHNTVAVANRIFEMRLYNFFIGESRFAEELRGDALDHKPEFIRDGQLDVPLIMERFIETQKFIRNMDDEEAEKRFLEKEGREKFLTYLSPIINGVGTFSVEEQTRDRKRTDVVIHYRGRRYVVELKIWHGKSRNEDGEQQIIGYLDRFGLKTGYMLSFSFNKNKEPGVHKVHIGDKLLYEGVV